MIRVLKWTTFHKLDHEYNKGGREHANFHYQTYKFDYEKVESMIVFIIRLAKWITFHESDCEKVESMLIFMIKLAKWIAFHKSDCEAKPIQEAC